MRSRVSYFAAFFLIFFLFGFQVASGQSAGHYLQGTVRDALEAVVVGATVSLTDDRGQSRVVVTNSQGVYRFDGLSNGVYKLSVSAKGFALSQSEGVRIPAPSNRFDVQLTIRLKEEQVTTRADQAFGVDSNSSVGNLVLRGQDLDLLPDDPEDLAAALRSLSGPGAGPNGGQIFVDGFSGGRVPPKSSIREVRVSNNPFNAENDQPGFGRIDILTRPGSDKFSGGGSFAFNDESLNSRNPLALNRPDFQTRLFNFNFGGAAIPRKASYFVDFQRREEDDSALINATILTPDLDTFNLRQTVQTPRRTTVFGPRFDFALNPNNNIVARYTYTRSSLNNNGAGGLSLLSRAVNQTLSDHTLQLTHTSVLSVRTINETRFQFISRDRRQSPALDAPSINILDSFAGGGAQQGEASTSERRWNLENFTTTTRGNHILRLGLFLRRAVVSDLSRLNFRGVFTFAGGEAPMLDDSQQVMLGADGQPIMTFINSLERFRRTVLFQQRGLSPAQIRELGGGASQLIISGGAPGQRVSQFDMSAYFQDELRIRPNLTVTFGMRYEYQTNIDSPLNFAPRLFFAWAPGGSGTGTSGATGSSQPRFVIRAGTGIFYERFSELGTLEAMRFNGISQVRFNIVDPAVLDQAAFSADAVTNVPSIDSLASLGLTQNISRVATDFQAPYTFLNGIQVESRLPYGFNLFVLATRYRTLHVLRSRNINAPLPGTFDPNLGGGIRPISGLGDVFQYESSGKYLDKRLLIVIRKQVNRTLNAFFNYTTGVAKTDSECAFGILTECFPANSYDLSDEYGRVSFLPRHRMSAGATISIPSLKMSLSPQIIASTGQFFNITTGRDTNGDRLFTERPAFASAATRAEDLRVTEFGRFDINPAPGAALIPRNFGEGPNFFSVNLNASWTFGIDRWLRPGARTSQPGQVAQSGAAPRATVNDPRYKLTIGCSVQNLFNNVNFNVPVGNLSSPFFGQSISVAGAFGPGTPASAGGNRRIQTQLRFTF